MTNNVIDLRNQDRKEEEVIEAAIKEVPLVIQEEPEDILSWSTLEYEKSSKSTFWFLALAMIAVSLIIFGIFTKSYFFAVFIALAFLVMLMYAARAPKEISCSIGPGGINAGGKPLPFSDLKSFWIFRNAGKNELSLETKKALTPFIRLPLGDMSPEKVKSELKQHVPEEEHKELLTDQIARSLGF